MPCDFPPLTWRQRWASGPCFTDVSCTQQPRMPDFERMAPALARLRANAFSNGIQIILPAAQGLVLLIPDKRSWKQIELMYPRSDKGCLFINAG